MATMRINRMWSRVAGSLAFFAMASSLPVSAAHADEVASLHSAFDSVLGTELRAPRTYGSSFESRIAALANASQGRIGVAAMDLATG